jgi:hypothetical protein
MPRHAAVVLVPLLLAACTTSPSSPPEATSAALVAAPAVTRQHIRDDLYHYQLDIPVGTSANARVRVHRVVRELAPFRPRPSAHAVMLLHGDFASFVTNFVPALGDPASIDGLAPWLAARGIDVWGTDRRWTLPAADGDISDLGGMGVDQELGDINVALAFARATRLVTDGDGGPLVLGGFSHGGELSYAYAAADGRHVSGLAILDVYYDLAAADADLRAFACSSAAAERAALAGGVVDSDNSFFIGVGQLDRSAPDDLSPLWPPYTNRQALYAIVGVTWQFAPYTPLYHLAAPVLDGNGNVTALRESPESTVSAWLAAAPPHQSLREGADFDAIWCNDGTTPRASLANIRVPLYYLGAAGGFGEHGLYSTTQVSSKDVTTHVVHRFGAARVAEDFGHGDLLYATDAPALAWRPLAAWLARH